MTTPEPRAAAGKPRGRAILTILLFVAALASLAGWAYLRRGAAAVVDVAAPSDFGGIVRSSDLERVADASRGGALNAMSLALDLGTADRPARFAIGDRMTLTARAGEPSRCALYHRNATGAFRLFHPERGESFSLSPAQPWNSGPLRVTEPAGTESFLLLCRSEGAAPIELSAILARPVSEWRASFSALRADYDVIR